MKKYFLLIQLIIFCFPADIIYSQQEGWSILNLGHNITSQNKFAIGGTCLIFTENSSRNVFGFNINTGRWSSITASTTLQWTDVYANGNTAMILNDSVAVFYSAHQGNFKQLRFEGHIINISNKWAGCKENYCYLVTDTRIYIFDAEDSQIRSLTYTGVGTFYASHIESSGDYLFMSLANTTPIALTVVAYSTVTKTITEYVFGSMAESGASFEFMDHGFVVNSIGGPPYYGLGYSAYTGNFTIKTSEKKPISMVRPQYDPVCVNKKLCCLFNSSSEVDADGIATVFIWVYNTLSGTFDEFSYNYHYNLTHIVPDVVLTGGEGALHSYYDRDNGDKVNVILYNAYTRNFSQNDFNLTYNYRNTFYFGGHVIAVTTSDKIIFYDFINGTVSNQNSDWKPGDFPAIQSIKPGNEYVVTAYRDPAETDNTKFKILSFNGSTGLIKSVSYTPGSYYSTVFAAGNYSIVFLTNPSQPYSNIIYSAAQDKWITKSMTPGVTWGYKNAFCFHRYQNENITEIFDAGTGNETTIPAYPSTVFPSQLIFRDSILGMFGTDQKLYAFSSFNNTIASNPVNYYSAAQSDRMIFYNTPVTTNSVTNLLFDANIGKYVPLSTSDQMHGTIVHYAAGIKTALKACNKGFLFAYNPDNVGIVEAPFVSATALQYNGEAPFNVSFYSEISGGNAPISIMWKFGDGATSTMHDPHYTYTSPGTYIVEVTVTDVDGDTGICSLVITVNDNTTSIDDKSINKPKVYPVPSGDKLTLEIPEGIFGGNSVRLSIFDLSGRCVMVNNNLDLSSSPVTIDITAIPESVYLLDLNDGKISHKLKIIRMK
ncbi:MAG: PKD domain-containing protein [Bacteroidales bacterium]|nr:PKD domain-containing protein [Bacteroidales bacterium]